MPRLLLIDKGSSSIHRFAKSLNSRGYTLINKHHLQDALLYLKGHAIDLITLEISLIPELLKSPEFNSRTDEIPKIVLTDTLDIRSTRLWAHKKFTAPLSTSASFRDYKYCVDKLIRERVREQEYQDLQRQVKQRDRELGFYDNLIKTVASSKAIGKSINALLEKTRRMTDAAACSLLINDESLFEVLRPGTSKKIDTFAFNKGVGVAGWVLKTGEPLAVDDVLKDKRFNKKADSFSNLKIRSLVCAPLKMKDRVVGVLRIANKKGGGVFTGDDLNLLINTTSGFSLATERTYLHEKLKNDELTNLFNARHLSNAIELEIERSLRYKASFSVIFMDLDNFKKINDKFGHLLGSRVLIETANLLQNNLRKVDVISRYGGDEFVIILPQTSQADSFLVAQRLRKALEKNIFLKQENLSIRVTASFGIASFPDNAGTRDELLAIADKAMYRGKFSTKNTVYSAH